MPERVTKEERSISLAIEKARSAKEELLLSLENNRNPIRDESEHFKLKRPKAEKDTTKFESNDGPVSNSSYAGDMTKFSKIRKILKAILESDINDNPVWTRERAEKVTNKLEDAHEQLSKVLEDIKSGDEDMDDQMIAIRSIIRTLEEFKDRDIRSIKEGPEDPQYPLPSVGEDRL
jgi:hypothetical protein